MSKVEKIVLVDDNFTTNFLNKMIVERSNHPVEVDAFEDARQALEYFQKNPSEIKNSLIFLDINMPVMDGWEFVREFEKIGLDASNKLVMLTSSVDPRDQERAQRIKAINDYQSKPLTFEMLDEMVQKYFCGN